MLRATFSIGFYGSCVKRSVKSLSRAVLADRQVLWESIRRGELYRAGLKPLTPGIDAAAMVLARFRGECH